MATTLLSNLVDPEVMADLVQKKLVDDIRFAPLCNVLTNLVGRPGDELTLPSFSYSGDAKTVSEGSAISIDTLIETSVKAKVHKIGKAIELTDEAVISGFGDIVGEAANQVALGIASQMDNEVLATLQAIASDMTYTKTSDIVDDVSGALVLFGEDIDEQKVLLVNPADYKTIREAKAWCPASEIAADILIKGAVGEIHGCQVIVSNKLTAGKDAYIVKPGALSLIMKRDILLETDRDILKRSTVIAADEHFVSYLYDATKAIKIA